VGAHFITGPSMLQCILYVLLGFAISVAVTAAIIPLFKQFQFRQFAYEDAPQTHQVKTGTPTMGGVAFVAALLPLVALWPVPFALDLFVLVALCAAIGVVDDLMSKLRGKNLGLRARTKFLLSALVAIIFLRMVLSSTAPFPHNTLLLTPWFSIVAPQWLWLLLGIVAVTGTIHAVNLTDGLDGLATGTMVPPLVVFAILALQLELAGPAIASLLMVGGCFGFLVFNRYPARIFMGDTGSLALGALLSGVAIITGEMLLLILVGGVFVAEALSVIIQVTYFKRTGGKRIFRMSPLHHHFELGGWPETKVTSGFWLTSAVLSLMGFALVR
jgi:phospho-N-acetylmuramoyl-pentapeptide-transferase